MLSSTLTKLKSKFRCASPNDSSGWAEKREAVSLLKLAIDSLRTAS
jgi:hypothetical protein